MPVLHPLLAAAIERVPALLLTSANLAGEPPRPRSTSSGRRGDRHGGARRRRLSRRHAVDGRRRHGRRPGDRARGSRLARRAARALHERRARPASSTRSCCSCRGSGCGACVRRGRPVDAGLDLAASIATGLALHGVLLLAAFGLNLPTVEHRGRRRSRSASLRSPCRRAPDGRNLRAHAPFVAIGLAAGLAGWRLWTLGGDAPYHVGRVRRLLALDRLHLAQMPELVDGSNHPGYYVPLPHAAHGRVGVDHRRLADRGLPRVAGHARPARRPGRRRPRLVAAARPAASRSRAARSPPPPDSPACASGRSSPTRRASRRSCCGRCW